MSPAPGLNLRTACLGPTWSGVRWSWQLLISHLGDGYGLTAGKPMLVGSLTRPSPERESWADGDDREHRADAVAAYRRFATRQELE
jgi:hypothetical protein